MKTITDSDVAIVKQKLNFNEQSKILNIYHNSCLDGLGCRIVVENCFENVQTIRATYSNIDDLIHGLDKDTYDFLILTDISPVSKYTLDGFDNVLLLDHHDTALQHHDPENLKFVYSGEAAALLVKKFFEKYFESPLYHLDDLIMLINDYDMWIHKDPRSKIINELVFKYWDQKFTDRFRDGDVNFSEWELEYAEHRRTLFDKVYDNTDISELHTVNGCFFMVGDFVNDMCDRLLKTEGYKIAINKNPKSRSCSIRVRDIENFHLGNTLRELGFGGGHKNSGGLWEPDPVKFREKMEIFEKHMYDNYPELHL